MKVLVFYSGGKDSQAALILSIERYGLNNCTAVFCDTGWENPITYNHITETCKDLSVKLEIIKSKKYNGMIDLAFKRKRFPSTKARFCTQELKIIPAIDFILNQNDNLLIIEGIRRNESNARSKMNAECTYFKYYFEPYDFDKKGKPKFYTYRKKDIIKWCEKYNADKLRPIFNWSAIDTINFIKKKKQDVNPLYYMGFSRVGCFPCIMNNHSGLKLIIENHPEQWNAVKAAEIGLNSSFFKPDYIPFRFRTGITSAGKRYSTAEDIERYIKGKNNTIDLFDTETPGCLSVYNLCE